MDLARSLSLATGVAISPLLGASALGAWKYFKTPVSRREALPWNEQPWFWVTGLLVVALVGLKDALGTAMPPGLKKPADAAEVLENKLSAIVVAGAMLPMVWTLLSQPPPAEAVSLSAAGFAAVDLSFLYRLLMLPFALAVYAVVWMASHAINILILLSPWGVVDAFLKSCRMAVLSLLTLVSVIDPVTGALLSLVVVVIAWLIAGWSFRLMVFGSVFCWDWLTLRRLRFAPDPAANWVFTARKCEKVPVRTYGRLVRSGEGKLRLLYRPWLVLAERVLEIPADSAAIGRGLIYPSLVTGGPDSMRSWLSFPPRYRTHEEALGQVYSVPVTDAGLLRGLKAFGARLKELFGGGEPVARPAA